MLENNSISLPGDIEACHALIESCGERILELQRLIDSKDDDILCLKQRLQNLLRDKFGSSSEKLSPGQLSIFAQELEELLKQGGGQEEHDKSEPKEKVVAAKKRNGGGGRKPFSPKLDRIRKKYYPNESEMTCVCCGARKAEIGVEIVEQLDYVPASFKVIEHATYKYACKACQEGVVEGKKPVQMLNGGMVTEGVVAQIATAKFADHLPLYRQEQIYDREGVGLSRSSMGRWLDVGATLAKPVVDRMRVNLLQSKVIQADEIPINFIDKSRAVKKVKKGYAWAYYGDEDHPYILFDFQPDRCAERPKEILKGYTGFLLTDGYGGYEWYDSKKSANCNVHNRRYFEKALKYDKKKAGAVLAVYSELYKIEERIKRLSDEEIVAVRQSESLPLMKKIKELLLEWQPKTPPKTTLGVAINYALPRWEKLCQFTEHACLRMDTNWVENLIRPLALGRKNWLHIGSEEALETASILTTLVNTCKRLDINPFIYLRDIFIRLKRVDVCIDDLLPDRWKPENLPGQESGSAEMSAASVEALASL